VSERSKGSREQRKRKNEENGERKFNTPEDPGENRQDENEHERRSQER